MTAEPRPSRYLLVSGGSVGEVAQRQLDLVRLFEGAIEAIAAEGITEGCNPPANDHYCPEDFVTRGEMAVFLVRGFDYSDDGGGDLFTDDGGLFYENAADRLKTAGVTLGCNPPANTLYCGERNVLSG